MMIDVDEFLDQAFAYFNAGKIEEAEELLDRVQSISPRHGDLLYLQGLIALKKNILPQAYNLCAAAVQYYPKTQVYQEALADVLKAMEQYDQAQRIYATLKQTDSVRFKEAQLEKEVGHTASAIQKFKELLSTSEAANACLELAFLENEKKKLFYLKKSFALSPNSKNASEIVKYLLSHKMNVNLEEYLKYIDNEFTLACVDIALHKLDPALKKLEDYTQKNPYDESAWLVLGQLYEKLKRPVQAEEAYQKVLEINSKSFEGHQKIAKLLMKQSRFSEALNHYQITCRMQPDNKETLSAMAVLTEHTNNFSEAIGLHFRLMSFGEQDLSEEIQRNIFNLAKENLDLARQFAKGWVTSFPQSKTAQEVLKKLGVFLLVFFLAGISYADLTQDEKQWQILWETKMAETGDPVSLFYLGELFETGEKVPQDFAQAIQYYEKSARQGYLPACIKLGKIFATHPVLKDEKKSIQWYSYAANKGDIQADFYLADYYQKHKDYRQAKDYLEKALKQTFPDETDFSKVSPQYASLLEKMNQKNDTLTERKMK